MKRQCLRFLGKTDLEAGFQQSYLLMNRAPTSVLVALPVQGGMSSSFLCSSTYS